jgi:hypothetical protein
MLQTGLVLVLVLMGIPQARACEPAHEAAQALPLVSVVVQVRGDAAVEPESCAEPCCPACAWSCAWSCGSACATAGAGSESLLRTPPAPLRLGRARNDGDLPGRSEPPETPPPIV